MGYVMQEADSLSDPYIAGRVWHYVVEVVILAFVILLTTIHEAPPTDEELTLRRRTFVLRSNSLTRLVARAGIAYLGAEFFNGFVEWPLWRAALVWAGLFCLLGKWLPLSTPPEDEELRQSKEASREWAEKHMKDWQRKQ